MKPSILVVTATLGTRKTIEKTITSVKNIGKGLVKHVIIAPEHAILTLKQQYPDLEYIAEPQNKKGIYAALNYAFYTYGNDYKYLTFINDDDYWLPQFQILIDTIIQNTNLDFVYGKTLYINEDNIPIGKQTSANMFKKFIPLLNSNIILLTQQATLIKSSLFFQIGGFDENYKLVADTKFWAILSLKDINYKYINKCCAAYTLQEGQLSADTSTQSKEHLKLIKELPQFSKWENTKNKIIFRLNNLSTYINRLIKQ